MSVNNILSGAGDLYVVRDLRTRARKEPDELAANKNLNFIKVKGEEINNFNKKIYDDDKTRFSDAKVEGFVKIYLTNKDSKFFTDFNFF